MEPTTLDGVWSQVRLWREAQLEDELQCTQWCIRAGLLNSSRCWRHRQDRQLILRADRNYISWHCTGCKDRLTVTDGSIFKGSNLPLGQVLMLAQCYANQSTYDATRLACRFSASATPHNDHTINRWFSTFRLRITDQVANWQSRDGKIGGQSMIVQIDEAQIMRRKYNQGRWKPDTWVCGIIDEAGNLRMEVCEKRDKPTLHSILQRHVLPGSIVHSDGWASYTGLKELGFQHSAVNHKVEFVAADGTHTQRIESNWRNMRRRLRPHEDLVEYMAEYMWLRDCAHSNKDPFAELMKLCEAE